VVVTMGCGDACPFIPGKRYLDWELDDPKGRGVEAVRGIRDEVGRRIAQLATEFDASARACQGDPPTPSHCSAWPPRAG
jgi:arsenate reductase